MHYVTAPKSFADFPHPWVFLAGSIEMGVALDWQKEITSLLEDEGFEGTVINPRREDWDPSWRQEFTNPQFYQQVMWELSAIQAADLVLVYFDPETKSPITLMELGVLTAKPTQTVVCCPEGFWRKGNVDVVCNMFGISMEASLEALVDYALSE